MPHKIKAIKRTVKPWHGLKPLQRVFIPMPKDAWQVEIKPTSPNAENAIETNLARVSIMEQSDM